MNRLIVKIILFVFIVTNSIGINASDTANISSSYKIGPGDRIAISVWKEEGMQQEVLVRPDGGISFPLAGSVSAGGMSASELEEELVSRLKRYIPNPIVTVSVIQANSNMIYVVGKVNRPGEFPAIGYIDVLQALSKAGGLTPFADSDDIKVIRKIDGKTHVKLFDYDDVISGERLDMNITLQAGDTVVVP